VQLCPRVRLGFGVHEGGLVRTTKGQWITRHPTDYGAHESLPFTAPDQPADPTAQADPNDQLLIALKPEFTLRMIDAAYSTH